MVVKLSGSKASSSLKSGKSVNAGSFSAKSRSTSVSTGKAVSSFKILSAPGSSFSKGKSTGGSFKSGTYNPSKTKIPTPTKIIDKKITPVAGIKPVTNEDVISKVKSFATIHIVKPTPVTVKKVKYTTGTSVAPAPKTTVKSSSGSSKSSGKWGGTGSLKATTSLSSEEKQKKGITGSSYTQGSVKTPRPVKSYNTGKTETM